VLVSTVELLSRVRESANLGLTGTAGVGIDWKAVIERKNGIVASWSAGKGKGLEKAGVTVLKGRARFVSPHELRVDGRAVSAEKIIIATGALPARPPIAGVERALTSDELLELTTLPARMVVVGGGFIGLELGFAFARAGTSVTVLQSGPLLLPRVDHDMREALLEIGRRVGIAFATSVKVVAIESDRVAAKVAGAARSFPADVVLLATGRPANLAGLGLEAAGVAHDSRGVRVNDHLQSVSAPHVFAAGDAAGRHQHTPVAWYEGPLAARNAVRGPNEKADYGLLPTALFTIPALGQVGLTEEDARRTGAQVVVHRTAIEDNPAAGVRGEEDGLVKIVYEEGTERLLGVHVLGPHAEDLVQIAAVAMRGGLTRREVASTHYVFPTLGGAIFDAMAGW